MGENLRGRNRFEQFPVDRNQSPGRERGDAGDEGGTLATFCGGMFCRRQHRIALYFTVHIFGQDVENGTGARRGERLYILKLAAERSSETQEFFRRTEATQSLSRRRRLRHRELAPHSDRDAGLSILRSPNVGGSTRGHIAGARFP